MLLLYYLCDTIRARKIFGASDVKVESKFSHLNISISIYRRQAAGTFYCYFRYGKQRHRINLETKVKREAEREARLKVQAVTSSTPSKGKLLLSDAITATISARWPKPDMEVQGYTDAKNRLEKFKEGAGDVDLGRLDRVEVTGIVQKYLNARGETRSARTVINDRLVISRLFSWLMKHGRVQHWNANPASSAFLSLPAPVEGKKHVATQEEIEALLARATGVFRAVVVLVLSGLRPVGACRCRWADIDFDAGVLRVMEKRKTREVRLSGWAVEELRKIDALGESVWPRPSKQFFAMFQTHARTMKLDGKLSAYALRRAAVKRIWSAGVPAEKAAKMLGHSVRTAETFYKALEAMDTAPDVLDWSKVSPKSSPQKKDDPIKP